MSLRAPVIEFSKIKASCSRCSLRELCLPRGLLPNDLKKLEYVVRGSRPIHKGKHIFRKNDPFEGFYAVHSGSIKSYIIDKNGEEQINGFYFPGEILGFDAVDQYVHRCSAVTMETSSYCSLAYEKINEICKEIPSLQNQILRLMSRELTNENKFLLRINKRTAEERIAIFLLNLSSRFKKIGYSAREYDFPMSRQEIGNYLGLTNETVSRVFSKLQRNGLVSIKRNSIRIEDFPTLHAICNDY